MKRAIAGLLLLGTGISQAGGLDLSLSNETANLAIYLSAGSRYVPQSVGGTQVSIGVFTNEIGDNLIHGTIMALGVRQSPASQYKLGAGIKVVAGDLDIGESVGALALGFQSAILLLASSSNPVDVIVEGFYAPSISSFNNAENYTELSTRLQIEVIPRALAFVGYRRILFDTDKYTELTVDRSVHVGLSIRF